MISENYNLNVQSFNQRTIQYHQRVKLSPYLVQIQNGVELNGFSIKVQVKLAKLGIPNYHHNASLNTSS